ncbi:aminoglycoside 6-adenylyltransferase [Paenibacillus aurantiacus]|uniref:Aminoglycoside 6-adenylyltransferase n=1 Tax=Paenibacillus aurantiacus TaxID=1936118 RepID=A0ABV5KW52_9BACL
MRSDTDMLRLLLDLAERDERIRLVTLEGSRTNRNIPADIYQDYDISYFVTDLEAFKQSDRWLQHFGEPLMMQKPEAMELFPPELGNWFSYLILFKDGVKLDLTLIPIGETDDYFAQSDGLVEVLLDKDARVRNAIVPSDRHYWIRKPTAREFDDCCNEFWMASTYVVKGLTRQEILYAIDHLHEVVRPNLLRMMTWLIGSEHGYAFSVGKNYKFIQRYLPPPDWETLLSTYSGNGYPEMRRALTVCQALFRQYAKAVAGRLGYSYPAYDEAVTIYTERLYVD